MHTEFAIGEITLNLTLVLLLVLLNGVFVAAEFSLVKVRQTRITQLVSEGNKWAGFALKVNKKLDSYLSATQFGITLTSLALGWLGEPVVSELLVEPIMYKLGITDPTLITSVGVVIGFSVITFLHIVLGELAPKSIAIQKTEATALTLSAPLIFFYNIFFPFIWVLNASANALLRMIGIHPASEAEGAHSEEEIRLLMNQSARSGVIDKNEMKLMDNIFEFSDLLAREVMLPRTDMVCLYANLTLEDNIKIISETKHSRYPVALEDKDQILGFIHITDLLLADKEQDDITSMLRPILNVPESMEISHVLSLMQKKHAQITLVVDEYGGTAGMLTAEEILEEIVGELYDEFEDDERENVEVNGDVISVEGRMLIEDVNDLTGVLIEDNEVDSIGGWLFKELDGDPTKGKRVQLDNFIFQVEESTRIRITRVMILRVDKKKHITLDQIE